MSGPYFLGVDGGATKTKAVVCNAEGRVLGSGLAGASNYHFVGLEVARVNITGAIQAAVLAANVSKDRIKAIGLGMAGVDSPDDKATLEQALQGFDLPQCMVIVNDGRAALMGATGGRPGVVVIAGTGAIAFGVNAEGDTARAGGWGYILGDEGSAYDIGRRGMVATLWAYDARGQPTTLLERLREHYQLQTIRDLLNLVYDAKMSHQEIAAFAQVVSTAALEGDAVAQNILRQAGEVLALSTLAVLRRLGLDGAEVEVAAAGSVLENDVLVRQAFEEAMRREAPLAGVISPRHEAAVGAALLAAKAYRDGCSSAKQ